MTKILTEEESRLKTDQNITECIYATLTNLGKNIKKKDIQIFINKWMYLYRNLKLFYALENIKLPEADMMLKLKSVVFEEDMVVFKTQEEYSKKMIGIDAFSKIGGISSKVLELLPFVCLGHRTTQQGIENILKYRLLDHRASLWKKGISIQKGKSKSKPKKDVKNLPDFPGVYCTLVTQHAVYGDNYLLSTSGYGDYTLIISLAVLQQRNWHFNTSDNYGDISNNTFTSKTLPTYAGSLEWLWKYASSNKDNEFIVHDGIPLDLIEGVIVTTEENAAIISNLNKKYNTDLIVHKRDIDNIAKFNTKMTNTSFNKNMDNYNILLDVDPQLCYVPKSKGSLYDIHILDPYTNTIKLKESREEAAMYLKSKMLVNCGLDKFKDTDDIRKKMQDIIFESSSRIMTKENPPYKYTPSYYGLNSKI